MGDNLSAYIEKAKELLEKSLDLFKLGYGQTDRLLLEVEKLKASFSNLYEKATRMEKEEAMEYLFILDSLQGIIYSIEGIVYSLKQLTKERIPLSDKAVREVEELKESVSSLLKDLSDLLKIKNKTLAEAIAEKAKNISKKADSFSLEHEERVIAGICTPKASPIYLNVLTSVKGISYNIYKIAKRVLMS